MYGRLKILFPRTILKRMEGEVNSVSLFSETEVMEGKVKSRLQTKSITSCTIIKIESEGKNFIRIRNVEKKVNIIT